MVGETSTTDHVPKFGCPDEIRVAFETNGKGWLGYLEELPGAFVRGATQTDCLAKAGTEVSRYLGWLGSVSNDDVGISISRIVQSDLCIEDADNAILLETDAAALESAQFRTWSEIALYSAACFGRLYTSASHRQWQDPARMRETFLGACPASIDDIYAHVDHVQGYYLQCLRLDHHLTSDSFVERRRECLVRIRHAYSEAPVSACESQGESWTIAKALRRYIWHDRIHAKSIVRTLQRLQIEPGRIKHISVDDPFGFGQIDITVRTELL